MSGQPIPTDRAEWERLILALADAHLKESADEDSHDETRADPVKVAA